MKWQPGIRAWSVLLVALVVLTGWTVIHGVGQGEEPLFLLSLGLCCSIALQFVILLITAGRGSPERDYAVRQEVERLAQDIEQLRALHSTLIRHLTKKDPHAEVPPVH